MKFDLQLFASYWTYGNYHFPNSVNNTRLNTHRYSKNEIRTSNGHFGLNPNSPNDNDLVMLSTNVFIYANDSIVGMIQSFTVNEQRQINKLQAIGWEGVVQSVPSNTRGGSLNVNRIALYDSTLFNALGLNTYARPNNKLGAKIHTGDGEKDNAWDTYDTESNEAGPPVSDGYAFRTLKDQRAPIEIQVRTPIKGTASGATDMYILTYIDC